MRASDALSLAQSQRPNQREQTKKALHYARRKIATAATLGEMDIVLLMPDHFDGANYDREAAFKLVVRDLRALGYHTQVLSPSSVVYVSWRYANQKKFSSNTNDPC